MIIPRIGSVLFVLAGLYFCVVAAGNSGGIEHTVENSRKLNQQFRSAAQSIKEFETRSGRLPTEAEFHAMLPTRRNSQYDLFLSPQGFAECDGAGKRYSQLPVRDYVLAAWRGEWFECSAPTKGWSTLLLNPRDYAMTRSVILDSAVFAFIATGCFGLAIWLWRYRGNPDSLCPVSSD